MSAMSEGMTLSAVDVESFKNMAYRLGRLACRAVPDSERGATGEDLLGLCGELANAAAPMLARDFLYVFIQGVEDEWNGEPAPH